MIRQLIWNIRGVANNATLRRLKSLVRLHSISTLVLLEPLINSNKLDEYRIKLGFDVAFASPTGRIWLFCKSSVGIGFVDVSHEQVLHVELTYPGMDPFILSAIYAKSSRGGRSDLWSNLCSRKLLNGNLPWMVGGISTL